MLVIIKVVGLEKKKIVELIGSIFVAVIFLSSYAAFGGLSGGTNSTTTTISQQTFYAVAHGNANITSYGPVLNVNISCSNITNVSDKLNGALTALERNGSVSNFYAQQASQVLVQNGSMSTYRVFQLLAESIGSGTNCTEFDSPSANIRLQQRMNFNVPQQRSSIIILVPDNLQKYTLPVKLVQNMSSSINVTVSTLLTLDGTIYGSMVVKQT